jgi:hypothetical protein
MAWMQPARGAQIGAPGGIAMPGVCTHKSSGAIDYYSLPQVATFQQSFGRK